MALLRVFHHCPEGEWPSDKAAGTLTLDYDSRHRRRLLLISDDGEEILLDLPKAVAMRNGDGLQLEDGRWVMVHADTELLLEIRHPDPAQLIRIAWHLGNRHLPTDIQHQILRIRPDHVIEHMLQRLGAEIRRVVVPFQPEGGAYGDHSHASHEHSARQDE
jgi:urease accessory protein